MLTYKHDRFVAKCVASLPDRRVTGDVARVLAMNQALAQRQGVTPYMTIKNVSLRREVQHRNATRAILAELAEVGLIGLGPTIRDDSGYRRLFWIQWSLVLSGDYKPFSAEKPARTAAQAELIEERERQAAEQRRQQEAERAAQEQAQARARMLENIDVRMRGLRQQIDHIASVGQDSHGRRRRLAQLRADLAQLEQLAASRSAS